MGYIHLILKFRIKNIRYNPRVKRLEQQSYSNFRAVLGFTGKPCLKK